MTLNSRIVLSFLVCGLVGIAEPSLAVELPKMQFNEVKEIAPGVFFRYSSISATDQKVPFGGSNNIWVVFEDYVVVIDANFPKEAADVVAAVKKTTSKPIRYVFDTHHHGDHAYGNAVFAQEGASVISSANCARIMRQSGAEEFKKAGEGPTGRKDIKEGKFKAPNVVFDDKLVLDDGKQRVEFLFLGHAHTPGDAVAYLPHHKFLCTGDACVNGAYNYTGHSDTASWVRVMEKAQQLDVNVICPGHGPLADQSLLERQKRYFIELRQQVRKGLDANKSLEEIIPTIDMPWYKEWTGVEAKSRKENVEHVYGELTGRVLAWDLVEDFGLKEGPSPTKDDPGWTKPKRIVVPNLMPTRLKELKLVAPDVEFVPVRTEGGAAQAVADADAVIGFTAEEVIKAGKNLRWIHGTEASSLLGSRVVLTDTRDLDGLQLADQALALLLSLPRIAGGAGWQGKTLLICGPGGDAMARRAEAFGMRAIKVDKAIKLKDSLASADAIALIGLSADRGVIAADDWQAVKKGAYLVATDAVGLVDGVEAGLKDKRLAAAGLIFSEADVPAKEHPLWTMSNVVLATRTGRSPEALEREWRLLRENVRRFVAGEQLLSVVGK